MKCHVYGQRGRVKAGRLFLCLILLLAAAAAGSRSLGGKEGPSVGQAFRNGIREKTQESIFPVYSFMNSDRHENSFREILYQLIREKLALYAYCLQDHYRVQTESMDTYEKLVRLEGMGETTGGEEAVNIDSDMRSALEKENEAAAKEKAEEENRSALSGEFVPARKQAAYDLDEYRDFASLTGEFYAVDATTAADASLLNLDKLLYKDMKLQGGADSPQILIYHTHSQEAFADSVPGDPATSIVGAGERLAGILREKYGFNVLHHTGVYDKVRDRAYSEAAPALEQLLADYPSIEVVIDLHRDEVPKDRKLVTDIGGRPTARFMFFNGLSRTKKTGPIAYLENPYIDDNLAFAFQMQLACNEYYPGLTRKIYLKGYRYNMHYCPRTLLIEMGAQTNTVEEIMNACDPLAHVLSMVLNGTA